MLVESFRTRDGQAQDDQTRLSHNLFDLNHHLSLPEYYLTSFALRAGPPSSLSHLVKPPRYPPRFMEFSGYFFFPRLPAFSSSFHQSTELTRRDYFNVPISTISPLRCSTPSNAMTHRRFLLGCQCPIARCTSLNTLLSILPHPDLCVGQP